MNVQYITVENEVREYVHVRKNYRDAKHKPKCPNCSNRVQYIYFNSQKVKKLGFICIECNTVFIDNKHRIFAIKNI